MQRRGFLKRLLGAATAVVVSEKLIPDDGVALSSIKHPVLLHDAAHHELSGGFGLASVKAEGATIPYDLSEAALEELEIDVRPSGIMKRADFVAQLRDGLNKAFKDVYADHEPDDWPKPG